MSASENELERMHSALAEALTERIASGEASASDLNVARAFLKDNGIDAIPRRDSPLGGLVGEMQKHIEEDDRDLDMPN